MSDIEVAGKKISRLVDGRLSNLSDWNEDVAEVMAGMEHLTLTDDHWNIIRFFRDYYREFNISPVRKLLKNELKNKYGEAKANDEYFATLFPNDILIQGSRIAGVPTPYLDAELEQQTYSRPAAGSVKVVVAATDHFVESFEFEGQTYLVSAKGNLQQAHTWNERVAVCMAAKEGLSLNDDHWVVINFMRKFYFEYGITPMVKILMRHMSDELSEQKSSKDHLYRLFPKGPSRQGSRIAGLPEPQGCID